MTDLATGALVGSAVGDALGAPFEFGPPGAFSRRFPAAGDEMCGGGPCDWEPGEFTDDTQQALLVGESLLECGGLDEADMFGRFQRWLAGDPPDVGIQTRAVLSAGLPWDQAARAHRAAGHRSAGNGSLMRTTPAAIYFAASGAGATMSAARRISALTHGDPAAGAGTAIFHELIRRALAGEAPLPALPAIVDALEPEVRPKWATVLGPQWTPADATEPNGAVWPTLGTAVWAVRTTDSFESALRAAADVGNDTDTVAAVTGGLAGAIYGYAAIPERWTAAVHGRVPGFGDTVWRLAHLRNLAGRLSVG